MLFAAAALIPIVALALSREAEEFIAITKELEPRLRASRDREDLEAISRQSRDAIYHCE